MLNTQTATLPVTDSLRVECGAIARITLTRPAALNAFDVDMATAFHDACQHILAQPETRVLVIGSEGRAFSAGGDVACMHEDPTVNSARIIEPLHDALRLLESSPIPVVARLHGMVAGGAVGLALMCDFVIAAESTRFNLAYARLGASCDCGGSWVLPRLVGWRRAMNMVLLEPDVSIETARQYGMVNQVVADDLLDAAVLAVAEQLSKAPRQTVASVKNLMRQSLNNSLSHQLEFEAEEFAKCAAQTDFPEGLSAFMEKRRPAFGP